MCNFKTESITVKGWKRTAAIVSDLVESSCWFEVTPLPFDKWEVTTKAEGILAKFSVK